ncbi:hypothetical protein BMYO_1207 [Bifidobacterium myosotis]|uniref:Uncharacterized protein n=1 Tax=Bifidobacterium myosotis TaxID=1630166 RepID=A0A261FKG3_9BIFI|nr:hypothetical protein BMYO_1207 [Bifidobacterium myosotis]
MGVSLMNFLMNLILTDVRVDLRQRCITRGCAVATWSNDHALMRGGARTPVLGLYWFTCRLSLVL